MTERRKLVGRRISEQINLNSGKALNEIVTASILNKSPSKVSHSFGKAERFSQVLVGDKERFQFLSSLDRRGDPKNR